MLPDSTPHGSKRLAGPRLRAALVLAFFASAFFVSSGCGYRFVGVDDGGPVKSVYLGPFEDDSPQLDLGDGLTQALRRRLSGRPRPRLLDRAQGETWSLKGRLTVGPELPVAFEDRASALEVQVRVEARLERDGGRIGWSTPVVIGRSIYLPAATATGSLDARRVALLRAVDEAASVLAARYLDSPDAEGP